MKQMNEYCLLIDKKNDIPEEKKGMESLDPSKLNKLELSKQLLKIMNPLYLEILFFKYLSSKHGSCKETRYWFP